MHRTAHTMPERIRPFLAPLLVLLLLTVVYGLVSLRVAAWVGGRVISRAELATRIQVVQFIYDRQFGQDPNYDAKFSRKYQRDVLDQLAEESVLLQAAAGLATEAELNTQSSIDIDLIKVGYFQGDDAKLEAALADLGITRQDLQVYFANSLLLTRLRTQQVKDVTVPEGELRAYFEENKASFALPEMVKVSHIVVATSGEAEQLLADLTSGRDFSALAKEKSLDQETAAIGGGLRWFQKGEMQAAFEKAAFALEPGQTSGVVQTSEGFHVIKMESKQPATPREYADLATNLIKSKALAAKQDGVWDQYRRTMRGKQLILLIAR